MPGFMSGASVADGTITSAKLADNAVTLAKMAGGTDGNLIGIDASGDPAYIATGSDGQVLTSGGAGVAALMETAAAGGMTLGTEQATTSGSAFNFTSIASGTNLIIMVFNKISTDGTGVLQVQIGDSGGLETSGYISGGNQIASTTHTRSNITDAFLIVKTLASGSPYSGLVYLARADSASLTWMCTSMVNQAADASQFTQAGSKTLTAALDRVTILSADTFDAGSVNILTG